MKLFLEVIIYYIWKMCTLHQSGVHLCFAPRLSEVCALKCAWRFYQH